MPPGQALALAEKLKPALMGSNNKPVFVECNAVSPQTVDKIAAVVAETGCPFIDGGIIGPPPRIDSSRTKMYVSGPDAARADLEKLVAMPPDELNAYTLYQGYEALAIVLLVGAGLLVRSLIQLQNTSPGFDAHNVMTMNITLSREKYSTPEKASNFFQELEGRGCVVLR